MKLFFAVIAMLLVSVSWAAGAPTAAQGASLKGSVLEVKDVDAYTYLRIKTTDGETWAAVGKAPVKVGTEVTIENPMVMNNFESKTLKKSFDRIVFGNLAGTGATAPSKDLGQIHGGLTKTADVKNVKVAKASGPDARTVGEIVTKRTELKDKPVTVRGTVVKFTGGVMGKNWVHLRDGTGNEKDGTNDLVVTTLDETKIGDVVLVKGIVRTDINLGSGYSYAVLVEDAKLQK
jgi:hypothetical protein